MLSYQAVYRLHLGAFLAEVVDFPDVSAFGATLSDARNNLVNSLRYAAERRLRRGGFLPIPDHPHESGDAYLIETLTLLPTSDDRVAVLVG
jgi:predicted RNase H-like HicB family nuclease